MEFIGRWLRGFRGRGNSRPDPYSPGISVEESADMKVSADVQSAVDVAVLRAAITLQNNQLSSDLPSDLRAAALGAYACAGEAHFYSACIMNPDPGAAHKLAMNIASAEQRLGKWRGYVQEIVQELNELNTAPVRLGDIVSTNAHSACVLYMECIVAMIWNAVGFARDQARLDKEGVTTYTMANLKNTASILLERHPEHIVEHFKAIRDMFQDCHFPDRFTFGVILVQEVSRAAAKRRERVSVLGMQMGNREEKLASNQPAESALVTESQKTVGETMRKSLPGVSLGYHVFLSHNSKDKPAVKELKQRLVSQKLLVWYDEDELRPGIPWQPLLEQGIKSSASVAVLVGKDGIGPWENEEMQAALQLAARDERPVIPVLLPGAPTKPELTMFLLNRTWVDLRGGYTADGLTKLVWGITGVNNGESAT